MVTDGRFSPVRGPHSAAAAPAASQHSHDDAATLLNQTKLITADQRILTMLDRRVGDQHQLSTIYGQWAALVELQLSVGFYIMTSKFLETFDIDLQPVEQVV